MKARIVHICARYSEQNENHHESKKITQTHQNQTLLDFGFRKSCRRKQKGIFVK